MNEQSFEKYGLSEELLKSISKLGYKNPTKVQNEVIPYVLEGRDLIVGSQTGSGKTASFGIPVCERIEVEIREPQALILTPTRELCVQVKEDISNIGRFKKIRCASIFGKQPVGMQIKELKQRVHVVVGTPGRTMDHIERGSLILDNIKYLIIDEADKMLNMGFIEQVEAIINTLPREKVTMLFSATIHEEIETLCSKYMSNPIRVEVSPESKTVEKIEQALYEVSDSEKFNLLNKIIYIENPDSCIIFCRTKENVENLYLKMKNKGYSCSALHGGMLQNDRLETMLKFKNGEFSFLIATDVAARGIDIENLSHIINYDIPVEKESYVHRIGRTGRAGSSGKAITFVSPYELKILLGIEDYIGYKIARKEIPSEEEAHKAQKIFSIKSTNKPKLKTSKSYLLNKEITKIYINAGKKKKIRAGDIVGAVTGIDGVNAEDIGIVNIMDNHSYIDVLNGKGELILEALQYTMIKGKTVRAQRAAK